MPRTFAIVVLVLATTCFGQNQQIRAGYHIPDARVSIDFRGGSLASFVRELQRASGARELNIVVSPDAEDYPIPAFSLKNVEVSGAFHALSSMSSSNPASRLIFDRLARTRPDPTDGNPPEPVYAISIARAPPSPFENTSVGTSVFVIRDLVEPMDASGGIAIDVQDVLSAIEVAATSADGTGPNATKIQYHPDTYTLIATGLDDTRDLIDELLSRLRADLERRQHVALQKMSRTGSIRMEVQRARLKLERAEARREVTEMELAHAQQTLDERRALYEAGAVSGEELANAEFAAASAKQALRETALMIEQERLQFEQAEGMLREAKGQAGELEMRQYDVRGLSDKAIEALMHWVGTVRELSPTEVSTVKRRAGMLDVSASDRFQRVFRAGLEAVRAASRG